MGTLFFIFFFLLIHKNSFWFPPWRRLIECLFFLLLMWIFHCLSFISLDDDWYFEVLSFEDLVLMSLTQYFMTLHLLVTLTSLLKAVFSAW